MKREFKIIAAGLGIILPASLSGLGEAQASNVVDLSQSAILKNDVSKRILNFQVKDFMGEQDNTLLAHTNSHTDVGGNHSDSHSNIAHSNYHTNKEQKDMCPAHVDTHSDRDGRNSHTNEGRTTHSDHHTNKADAC